MIYPCFENKVALITGGTRGIGRRIAELLADSGCDLALVYRHDRESADAAQKDIENKNISVITIKADVSKEDEIPGIFAEVRKRFGRLDYLVSNAVYGVLKPIGEFTGKRFDISMNANAKAYLLIAQAAADMMVPAGSVDDSWERPAGGLRPKDKRIVALSSLGSHITIPGYAAIGASKAAIESLTRYLAVELAPRGIGVNAVSGGLVETESLKAFSNETEWMENQIKKTPLGRIGEPDDIAKVAVWLLSDQAVWVTGQTIIADGGLSLK
jgi:enoyl-[acyl-carrier protein] reductase III